MKQEAPSEYERVAEAIRFVTDHRTRQPGLSEVAAHVGLSPFHFQRLFRDWAGVSPKQLLQVLTVEHAKELLDRSASVLGTTWEVGLSSPARLHDHFVTLEAVSPGEYKAGGRGLEIHYGAHSSPFGRLLLATTPRGICRLRFLDDATTEAEIRRDLETLWPGADLVHDSTSTADLVHRIFEPSDDPAARQPLHLQVRGTNFQVQVWRALLTVPSGWAVSYGHLARAIGRPRGARAVGGALAENPIGFLIPCHRVIRGLGLPGGYRWGTDRKRALLAWEALRAEEQAV